MLNIMKNNMRWKVLILITIVLFQWTTLRVEAKEEKEYLVGIELYKENTDSLSMGNAAVSGSGKYRIKQGKDWLAIQLLPMQIQDFRGFLGEIVANGKPVTILSYYEEQDEFNHSVDGTDERMRGKRYPKEVEFEIDKAMEWVPVEVYIPVMGQMGVGQQKARIKISYSEVVKEAILQENEKMDEKPDTASDSKPMPKVENPQIESKNAQKKAYESKADGNLPAKEGSDSQINPEKREKEPEDKSNEKEEESKRKAEEQKAENQGEAEAAKTQKLKAFASYRHPYTGEIEDSGKNEEIGQPMVENVLLKEAELEERDGKEYVTIGFSLAKYLKNIQFSIQNPKEQDFKQAEAEEAGKKEEEIYYRILLPHRAALLKVSMFVVPMEREVVFYINFPSLISDEMDLASGEQENSGNNSNKKAEANLSSDLTGQLNLGHQHGLLLKGSPELEIFSQDKAISDDAQSPQTKTERVDNTKGEKKGRLVIGGIIFFVLIFLIGIAMAKPRR